MINFDELPRGNPMSSKKEPGKYIGIIKTARMQIGKNSGEEYLQIIYNLYDSEGKSCGTFNDMQKESDKPLLQWKLRNFCDALELAFTGSFELKEVAKVCEGKAIVFEIVDDKKQTDQSAIYVFGETIYNPLKDWTAITGTPLPTAVTAALNPATDAPAQQATPSNTIEY